MSTTATRVARVRASLGAAEAQRTGSVDTLVVTNPTNVRWLTGLESSNAWVVLDADRLVVGTDGRYAEQARSRLGQAGIPGEVRVAASAAELRAELIRACAGASRVGFEAAAVTVAELARWEADGASGWRATTGVVERARRRKDATEIALIRRACELADAALAATLPSLVPGRSEAEVRNRLEATMRDLGADGPSYETIVAAGPEHAARPHHRPGTRRLEAGDLVIIDVGALLDGYHSDMTRTYVVGAAPTAEQLERYELVHAAQAAGLAAVRHGIAGREVDQACRAVIAEAGCAEWFVHGTGHGVGLDIHEDPYNTATSDDVLAEGDVVTVEPGVYRVGFGGIRIEDLVVVTSDGCQLLTAAPKDSPCLPSPPTT